MISGKDCLLLGSMLALVLAAATPVRGETPSVPVAHRDIPDLLRPTVKAAIDKVYPALVRIHVVAVSYGEGREIKTEASGSGVIFSADGHVITNHHVVGRAKRVRCFLANKEEREASVIGTDPLAAIAVLKLCRSSSEQHKRFPAASFGDSDALRVGDHVLAMGCPMALSQSVTLGIVSNVEMTLPELIWPLTFKLD